MVGYLTAILQRAAMPLSNMIRCTLDGSIARRDRVSPIQRRIIGSFVIIFRNFVIQYHYLLNCISTWSDESPYAAVTLFLLAISTRTDLAADKFCRITAQTLLVLVSAPRDSTVRTLITPSSTIRARTDFKSDRLHNAAAHRCFTFAAPCSSEKIFYNYCHTLCVNSS